LIKTRKIEGNAVTCLNFYKQNYLISGEANSDILKIWDLRMLKNISKDNYFDLYSLEYVSKKKGLFSEKSKSAKKSENFQIKPHEFSHYTAEIMHYEKVRGQYIFDRQFTGELKSHMTDQDLIFEETSVFLQDLEQNSNSINQTEEMSIVEKSQRPINLCDKLKKSIKEQSCEPIKGYTSLSILPNSEFLLANSINNTVYLYNLNALDIMPPKAFSGHKNSYYGIFIRN